MSWTEFWFKFANEKCFFINTILFSGFVVALLELEYIKIWQISSAAVLYMLAKDIFSRVGMPNLG